MLAPAPLGFDYKPPVDPWLTVLFSDDDLVILDKPSGLLSVAGNHPDLADCLVSRTRERWPTATVVHRLDKDTSGILVMALNKPALSGLGIQFEKRLTEKSYVARIWGHPEADSGRIDLPLATHWERKPRQRVDHQNGRPAQTDWVVIEREANATRVRLHPLTGRTHQLRVHMLELGHPILGDAFYTEGEILAAADRLQLHAEELKFRHPRTGEAMHMVVPAPF
jgi:tRNA pseudouridine32 synthase/23S rRNA pseudouridine746 synthase